MSCNHCNTKFNFFHKEMGCANCGLSLCSKCLKQKCNIKSKGSGEFNVCRICYKKLTSPVQAEERIAPPDKFLKRLEILGNEVPPTISGNIRQDAQGSTQQEGMSSADQAIANRLANLKEKADKIPSDDEIKERLVNLKGDRVQLKFDAGRANFTDTRSEQEKIDSLLEQLQSEQSIEGSYNPQDDLAERLSKLKGEKTVENTMPGDNEDSEDEIDQITKKIIAEASLEERCPVNTFKSVGDDNDGMPDNKTPELPWCFLCNDDAVYRCVDCEGDLFCKSCFKESHETWGMTDHKAEPFKQQ